jgi:hypothetical protein
VRLSYLLEPPHLRFHSPPNVFARSYPDLGEGIEIVQDDVVFLKKDGSAYGTEKGFFLKTDIDPVD